MEFEQLVKRPNFESDQRLLKRYATFDKLINELGKKEIPEEIVSSINPDIEGLNAFSGSDKELRKQLRKVQYKILKLIEKELKLTPKNHYRNVWMAIGIALGVPFGVVFGNSFGNMAFIGIGIPIGMAIGIGIGTGMDAKALKEGRQLDLEVI